MPQTFDHKTPVDFAQSRRASAQALLGPSFHVSSQRGQWVASPLPGRVLATVHPSSVLRVKDDAGREDAFARLVADLSVVARQLRYPFTLSLRCPARTEAVAR